MNTTETVQEFFARFGSGDMPGMMALFAEDVEVRVAGAGYVPWTGERTGRDAAADFFRRFQAAVQTQEFDVERTLVDGEDAVVLGSFAHKVVSTGRIFSGPFALRITVRDGLIRRYHNHEDSFAAAVAFAAGDGDAPRGA